MRSSKTHSPFGYVVEALAAAGLLFHALLVLGAWDLLPAAIPIHYDLSGKVDAWGDKSDLLGLLGINFLVYAGLTFLGRYPHKLNYPWQITAENAARQYELARNFLRVLKCEIVWLFAVILMQTIGVSLGLASGLGSFFLVSVIAVLALTVIGFMVIAAGSSFGNADQQ